MCVCVFLRESVCCVRYGFCIHCRFTSGWTEFHFPGWWRSPLLCPCQPQGSKCLCRNHIVEPVSGLPLNFTHTMPHSTSLNMPLHTDDIFPHFSRLKKKKAILTWWKRGKCFPITLSCFLFPIRAIGMAVCHIQYLKLDRLYSANRAGLTCRLVPAAAALMCSIDQWHSWPASND